VRRAVIGLLIVQAAAFWPVWRWYAGRFDDVAEALMALLALTLAVAVPSRVPADPSARALGWPALITAVYVVAFPFAAPLVRALLAMAALGATWTILCPDARVARCGLLLLATPLVPSLQFYLGYPLRLAVAHLAAFGLRLTGLAVDAGGVGLTFGDRLVLVDAPCSGVRMLWAAAFLALALSVLRRRAARGTLTLVAVSVAGCVLANAWRAQALFLTEAGIVSAPAGVHEAVGIVCLAASALLVVGAARRQEAAR
jgi:exosortase